MNTNTSADDIQKQFFEWLEKLVTPSQLSAILSGICRVGHAIDGEEVWDKY